MNQDGAAESRDSLSIFLAGAPGTSSAFSLQQFFQQFGKIYSVEAKPCRGEELVSSQKTSKPKYFWIIRTSDKETFDRIMSARPIYFAGRKLHLTAFRSGIQLILHNHRTSKKRVLVKRVPTWIDESYLINLIEQNYGKIQTYFRFEPDPSKPQNANLSAPARHSFTYSVTFLRKSDRDSIIAEGRLQIAKDVSVPVEKFMHTAELRKVQMQPKHVSAKRQSVPVSASELSRQELTPTTFQRRPTYRQAVKATEMDLNPESFGANRPVVKNPLLVSEGSILPRPALYAFSNTGRLRFTSAEYKVCELPSGLDGAFSKPSQRQYHDLRIQPEGFSTLSLFADLGQTKAQAQSHLELSESGANWNVRYNICKKQGYPK